MANKAGWTTIVGAVIGALLVGVVLLVPLLNARDKAAQAAIEGPIDQAKQHAAEQLERPRIRAELIAGMIAEGATPERAEAFTADRMRWWDYEGRALLLSPRDFAEMECWGTDPVGVTATNGLTECELWCARGGSVGWCAQSWLPMLILGGIAGAMLGALTSWFAWPAPRQAEAVG